MSGYPVKYWPCPKMWIGSTVVVIGGGPSLQGMDWNDVRRVGAGARYIACNDAYQLGWPDMCFFGDAAWYDIHSNLKAFEDYPGLKVSAAFECLGLEGLLTMERWPLNPAQPVDSLRTEPYRITWYGNTGTTAIALAAKLGARKIVLLGFDMMVNQMGLSNWYNNLKNKPKPSIYTKFLLNTGLLAIGMSRVYPEVEVINGVVGEKSSKLGAFETMGWKEALRA